MADWIQTLNSPSREVVTAMRSEGWKTREVTGLLHKSRGAGQKRTRKDNREWSQETEVEGTFVNRTRAHDMVSKVFVFWRSHRAVVSYLEC